MLQLSTLISPNTPLSNPRVIPKRTTFLDYLRIIIAYSLLVIDYDNNFIEYIKIKYRKCIFLYLIHPWKFLGKFEGRLEGCWKVVSEIMCIEI